jgi:CubicO group peptidase (beta-lactamase class C family)
MIEEINRILIDAVEKNLIPGASYCICDSDGNIICDDIGFKSLYPEKIIHSKDVIYDVASLTKVISTTTMIMQLIEEGKLKVDTKISEVLESFEHKDITVFDCLTHSSGLPADLKYANTLKNEDDVMNKIYRLDSIYVRGSHVVYSDIGFILLGKLIEKVTGEALNMYAKRMIFDPLLMFDTSYTPNKEKCAPTEYRNDLIYQGYLKGIVHDEKSFALNGISGHAGLFSTARDIAKFIVSILQNKSVINRHSIDELFKLRIEKTNLQGVLCKRAFGWDKPTINSSAGQFVDKNETILHTGFTGCNMFIDRHQGIGFVLLSNDVHPTRENKGIISLRPLISDVILKERMLNHEK